MAGERAASLHAPALPKARQWLQWLAYHDGELPTGDGWVRGLCDGVIGLHHQIVSGARRLRGNPTWDLAGTMTEDTSALEEMATGLLRRVETINLRDIPVRFETWYHLLLGACRQQVRLAHEIDVLRAGGTLHVDVTVDAHARRLIEAG